MNLRSILRKGFTIKVNLSWLLPEPPETFKPYVPPIGVETLGIGKEVPFGTHNSPTQFTVGKDIQDSIEKDS